MNRPLPEKTALAWRQGKPEEDPAKVKRWGFISAKPSEFLICMSGGKVVTSGQGASCFKWPWDSVAVVPTTVQRLHFTADQVTNEKVGVQIKGLAVYRIAEPLIAYRMLNFSYAERAQEKLRELLEEMFVGAVRRLVANLTIEQCLTRRKDALAVELMREIAPVVAGSGTLKDSTHKGWGVVLDSIEIQDVRVMSAQVFANMQARFRQEQERLAREAELAKERSVTLDETAAEQNIALARVATEVEIRRQRQGADESARVEKLSADARVEEARLSHEGQVAAAQHQARIDKLAADAQLEEARLNFEAQTAAAHHLARLTHEEQLAREARAQAEGAQARLELARAELEVSSLLARKAEAEQRLELERAAALRNIENTVSAEVIQLTIAQKLPELARAFQQNMGTVNITAVDGSNPWAPIAAALTSVIGIAKGVGLPWVEPKGDERSPTSGHSKR